MAVWLLDEETNENSLYDESNEEVLQQLIAYSNIIPNIDSIYQASQPEVLCYYFHFEKNELYTSYPLSSDCESELIYFAENASEEEVEEDFTTCLNDEGEYYEVYKIKCESFFWIC